MVVLLDANINVHGLVSYVNHHKHHITLEHFNIGNVYTSYLLVLILNNNPILSSSHFKG
jgi:hypothetical protein